jgi:thioredoxin-related protein
MCKQFYVISIIILTFCQGISAQTKGWFTSKANAEAYADSLHVPVLYVFAGSDWCKPCIQLKQTILLSEEFQKYFPQKMAILYLDFPQQAKNRLSPDLTRQNEALAAIFNTSGFFPYMVLVDTSGQKIGTLSFKNQPTETFIKQCEQVLKTASSL